MEMNECAADSHQPAAAQYPRNGRKQHLEGCREGGNNGCNTAQLGAGSKYISNRHFLPLCSGSLGAVFQETLIKQRHTTGLYLTFRSHINALCETVSGGLLIWEFHTEPAVCFLVLTRWFGTQLKGCPIGKSGDVGGWMRRFRAVPS